MRQGTIIFLNGTSSVGKTSIAKALREVMEAPFLCTGIDHFLGGLPSRLFVHSDGVSPAAADGWLLVFRGQSIERFETPEGRPGFRGGTLAEVRIGPTGLRLLAGTYRAIAGFAAAGNDVIVDDVIYDQRVLRSAVEALAGLPVLFVGLRCPREVAERRERERGDRALGGASAFYDLVHAHGLYDLELDTSAASPAGCALRIKEALAPGHPQEAFARLRRDLGV